MRARTYCLVGAAGCAVTAAELIGRVILRPSAGIVAIGYLIAAMLSIGLAIRLAKAAAALRREMSSQTLSEPAAPPDFSTLSDGSQIVRNLEQIK